jgi:hypothetical protein
MRRRIPAVLFGNGAPDHGGRTVGRLLDGGADDAEVLVVKLKDVSLTVHGCLFSLDVHFCLRLDKGFHPVNTMKQKRLMAI